MIIIFSSHLDKSGTARFTLVWLFSGVDTSMGLEIGWSVKLGAADVAVVWLCTWRFAKCDEYNSYILWIELKGALKTKQSLKGITPV